MAKDIEKLIFCSTDEGIKSTLARQINVPSHPDRRFFIHLSLGAFEKENRYTITEEQTGFAVIKRRTVTCAINDAIEKLNSVTPAEFEKLISKATAMEIGKFGQLKRALYKVGVRLPIDKIYELEMELKEKGFFNKEYF